jgi:hypothetical protein
MSLGFHRGLNIDDDSILGLLQRVNVDDVSEVSEVYAASILRLEGCRLVSFCVNIALF